MDKRPISETENRLLLLCALQALGPVTETELLRFVSELDLMSWLEMQLSLAALLDEGQLTRRPHPLASLLRLSDEGVLALETFRHKLPASRREAIEAEARTWQARFRIEQDTPTERFRLRDGRQSIRLRLLQQGSALMDLLLILPPEKQLGLLDQRWQRCAQAVYSDVLAALSDGFAGRAPAEPLPPAVTLQPLQAGEWLLCLTDRPQDPGFTLMLSIPVEPLARHMASRWPAAGEALAARITETICSP